MFVIAVFEFFFQANNDFFFPITDLSSGFDCQFINLNFKRLPSHFICLLIYTFLCIEIFVSLYIKICAIYSLPNCDSWKTIVKGCLLSPIPKAV